MNKSILLRGLLVLGSVAALAAPVLSQAADVTVTFGSPGYYQPTYVQRGYTTQPAWEQERDARRQRAIEWREHHGNEAYSYRGEERREARHGNKHRGHHDNGMHRGRDHNEH